MHKLSAPRILILTNVRLLDKRQSLDGIADVWGQYANAEWPGKLHSNSDLRNRWQAEQAELRRQPTFARFDQFGGWAEGPVRKATGFFRTERIDGKWWLVTPEGKLFFSIGLDCVNDSGETFITGRERMFAGLPRESRTARQILRPRHKRALRPGQERRYVQLPGGESPSEVR